MTQNVYGSGPCTTMLGFDTVEAEPLSHCHREVCQSRGPGGHVSVPCGGKTWSLDSMLLVQVGPRLVASHQPIWE